MSKIAILKTYLVLGVCMYLFCMWCLIREPMFMINYLQKVFPLLLIIFRIPLCIRIIYAVCNSVGLIIHYYLILWEFSDEEIVKIVFWYVL